MWGTNHMSSTRLGAHMYCDSIVQRRPSAAQTIYFWINRPKMPTYGVLSIATRFTILRMAKWLNSYYLGTFGDKYSSLFPLFLPNISVSIITLQYYTFKLHKDMYKYSYPKRCPGWSNQDMGWVTCSIHSFWLVRSRTSFCVDTTPFPGRLIWNKLSALGEEEHDTVNTSIDPLPKSGPKCRMAPTEISCGPRIVSEPWWN